jgi:hypothetical protein
LLIFLGISVFSFLILTRKSLFRFYFLPIFLGFSAILPFLGIRAQIITLFFTAFLWRFLIYFLERPNFSFNLIFYAFIFFLIWVNLHGGFFVGLLILFLFCVLEIFKKTNIFQKLISLPFFQGQNYKIQSYSKILFLFIVLIFSFLATLLNPYGLRIYEEIFLRTSADNFLRFHIVEWHPLLFSSFSLAIIFYLCLFLGLLICLRKKIEFSQLVLVFVFLFFSFLNQRHFPIFVILTIPIFAQLLFYFREMIVPERQEILIGGYKKWVFIFFILVLAVYNFYPGIKHSLQKNNFLEGYPEKALPFLKTLPLSENLFNDYGWGGYLIWRLPERKLFIDGRMPSWREKGKFVFGDYVKIKKAEDNYRELLERYDLKIFLLNKEIKREVEKYLKLEEKIKAGNRILIFFQRRPKLAKIFGIQLDNKNIYSELINLGWQVVYEDETAIILKK